MFEKIKQSALSMFADNNAALLSLLIIGVDLFGLYAYLGTRLFLLSPVWIFLSVYGIATLMYLYVGARILPRIPERLKPQALVYVVILAVAFRFCVLQAPPSLSTDMYRYVWDGRLIAHGINPYRWAPNSETLRFLRDPIWNPLEYKAYQTIYMSVSEFVFALGYYLFHENLIGFKFIYLAFDVALIFVIKAILARLGRDPLHIFWYAWCPLPIVEISLAGHQDVVGVFLVLLTFLLILNEKSRPYAAVALVGATLTKGFALLLIPMFARTYGRRFAVVAVVSLVYLSMPMLVYLPEFMHGMRQYLDSVNVNSGIFYFLNKWMIHVTRYHYAISHWLCDAIILSTVTWSCIKPAESAIDLLRKTFIILSITLLAVPTLFPWYLLWILPFMGLISQRPIWALLMFSGLVGLLYTYYVYKMPLLWVPYAEYVPFYLLLTYEYRTWVRDRKNDEPKDQKRVLSVSEHLPL